MLPWVSHASYAHRFPVDNDNFSKAVFSLRQVSPQRLGVAPKFCLEAAGGEGGGSPSSQAYSTAILIMQVRRW